MKFILLIALSILTGCASISEYNQGCRDGISVVADHLKDTLVLNEKGRDQFCTDLDALHKDGKNILGHDHK